MGLRQAILATLFLFVASVAFGRPTFKSDQITLDATAGQPFLQNMRDLLADQGTGNIQFRVDPFGQAPMSDSLKAWLDAIVNEENSERLASKSDRPNGNDVGVYPVFELGVKEKNSDEGHVARITVRVRPGWKSEEKLDLGIATERQAWERDLTQDVHGPSTGLKFQVGGLDGKKEWITADGQGAGLLRGTPSRDHVGKSEGIDITVTHEASGLSNQIEAFIEVKKDPIPPRWIGDKLPDAFENASYSANANTLVEILDPEAQNKRFELIIGPLWLQLNSTGSFFGNPKDTDVGEHDVRVKVSITVDGEELSDTTTLSLEVKNVNQPPNWKIDPVVLPAGETGKLYTQDLSGSATDPDGDTLTFKKIEGPAWAEITSNGELRGTPQKSDGDSAPGKLNQLIAEVSDGSLTDRATIQIRIIRANEAPICNQNPTKLPNAAEDNSYTQNLLSHVSDPDGDSITFTLLSGPSTGWATLNSQGILGGTPGKNDLGENKFEVLISDGEGSNVCNFTVDVDHTNHDPYWTLNPIQLKAKEDSLMNHDISGWAKDDDGDSLTFKIVLSSGDWALLSPEGVFTGTPGADHLGINTFTVEANDGKGGTATTRVVIDVEHVNHPPRWKTNPITLSPNAKERSLYQNSVADQAEDKDVGDTLTFSKVPNSGADWLTVKSDGSVEGTPQRAHLGLNEFQVRVMDQHNAFAIVTVRLTVDKVNMPPMWTQKPLDLPDAQEDFEYDVDISDRAADVDGDAIRFELVQGPTWLKLSSDGKLSGTPGKDDLGNFTATFRVLDIHDAFDDTEARGKVNHTNHEPIVKEENLKFQVKEREVKSVELNDPERIHDPDGDTLSFTGENLPDWLSLSSSGKLEMRPLNAQLNPPGPVYTVKVQAFDGEFRVDGNVEITVVRDPRAPEWINPPIQMEAGIDDPFTESLADKARDPDNYPLTFSKVDGPAWLTVNADGSMSGTPTQSQFGVNEFTVRAANQWKFADATLRIDVKFINHAPKWKENPLTLPTAQVDKSYVQDLSPFAEDKDGDTLTFQKINGPDWATVTSRGTLLGVPKTVNKGENTFTVRVQDPQGLFDDNTIKVFVGGNQPPRWKQDPINLGKLPKGQAVNKDISNLAEDPDGDALTFRMKSGPSWLQLSPQGIVTGTPPTLGEFIAVFEVLDTSQLKSDAGVIGEVTEGGGGENRPPEWTADPIDLGEIPTNREFNFDLTRFARDPDGDTLTYEKVQGPNWLIVDSNGTARGTPLSADLGAFTAKFRVKDPGNLSDETGAIGRVKQGGGGENRPPEWTADPIDLGEMPTNQEYNFDLTRFARDPDGDTLTYEKVQGPSWLIVESNGTARGTPLSGDMGPFTAKFRVKDPGNLSDETGGVGRVTQGGGGENRPPRWERDPIDLEEIPTNRLFEIDLSQFASDPDGDELTFTLKSGPNWLALSTEGKLSGVPKEEHLGNFIAEFEVSDGKLKATAGGLGKVIEGGENNPPRWTQDPIDLGNIPASSEFRFNLATFATDPDGDTLRFKKLEGPDWLTVDENGMAHGTPGLDNLGAFLAKFEVSDGVFQRDTGGIGRVVEGGGGTSSAKWKPEALNFRVPEREVLTRNINNDTYVDNPDNIALTFELLDAPDWVTLQANGDLRIAPVYPHIGQFTYQVKLTDANNKTDTAPMNIEVLPRPRKPVWTKNPIDKQGKIDEQFSANLNEYAVDLDGRPITFQKTDGKAWLNVPSNGQISGTPRAGDSGLNVFRLQVTNEAGLSADEAGILNVTIEGDQDHSDTIVIDTPIDGARIENLWVMDNSKWCNQMIAQIRKHIHLYYDALANAPKPVRAVGVYLSSDAHRWAGIPMRGANDAFEFDTNAGNATNEFLYRLGKGKTFNFHNSPIWAMFLFYRKLPAQLNEIFKNNDYFEPNIPMDVLVATRQNDHYRKLARNQPQENWSPSQFANNFLDFHRREKKPFRISAYAPDCRQPAPQFTEEELEELGVETSEQASTGAAGGVSPGQAYKPLTEVTGGDYYIWCEDKTQDVIRDYAQDVIRRAYINRRHRIKLTKTPTNPDEIEVRLNGTAIPKSSGKWEYDANANEIILHWHLFDFDDIPPGARLEIRYKVTR